MVTGIYKIVSPTGRTYIGQSNNIEERFDTYKKHKCSSQRLLHNSLKKYGYENHKKEIVIAGNFCKEELDNLEVFYIKYYNSFRGWTRKGMNLTTGGNSNKCLDNTVKQNISNGLSLFHKNIGHSVETKRKISIGLRNVKHSPETIEKRRKSNIKYWEIKSLKTPFSKYAKEKKKQFNILVRRQKTDRDLQIMEELKSGARQQLIALKYNLSPSSITQLKKKNNIVTTISTMKGSSNGWAKLNEWQVREIKILLKDKILYRIIAEKYSVKLTTIKAIASGQNWSHITI